MKNILSILAVAFGLATSTTQAQSNFSNDTDQIPPIVLLKYIEVREDYQIFDQQIAFAPISLESWSASFSNNRIIELDAMKWTDRLNETLVVNGKINLEESIPANKTPKSVKVNLFGQPLGEFTAQQLTHNESGLLGNSLLVYRF